LYTEGAELQNDAGDPVKKSLVTFAAAALMAVPTATLAQLASDEVPHQRTLPASEQIRRDLQTSRLRLGIFRIRPSFALRDFGYDNNVFGSSTEPFADWRSTVSAGARFIVPLGPKIYARGAVVPEYTWYRKLTDRRVLGGTYGGSLLALFNRLSVEGGADTFKGISILSSELEREAIGRRTSGYGKAEVEIIRRLSVIASAREERQRYDLSLDAAGNPLRDLQRNEHAVRGGLRYQMRPYFDVSLVAEKTRSDFLKATDRNNASRAVLLGLHYDRPRTFINLTAGSRTGEADVRSAAFPRYRTATGSYYASHELAARAALDVYGHRRLVYSLYADNAYFIETRNGVGIVVPVGRRIAVRAFGETGTNNYPRAVLSVKRTDDAKTWGGGLAFRFYRDVGLTTVVTKTQYTSNVAGQERSLLRVFTAISLQRELFR
jgi:hypothetical protein